MIKLKINNQDVEVESGSTILDAAHKLNIDIPTFCYDERLKSDGACRMCVVEQIDSDKLLA